LREEQRGGNRIFGLPASRESCIINLNRYTVLEMSGAEERGDGSSLDPGERREAKQDRAFTLKQNTEKT
jgi:hypothetical protein